MWFQAKIHKNALLNNGKKQTTKKGRGICSLSPTHLHNLDGK
jgi:hypothetical protein